MSNSPPFDLAYWFVSTYIGREWKDFDKKGQHLRHAQVMLKDYTIEQIKGCLMALRAKKLGQWPFPITALTTLRSGEPPLIQRYLALATHPPPIYETARYTAWCLEFGHPLPPPITQEVELCPLPPQPPLSSAPLRTRTISIRTFSKSSEQVLIQSTSRPAQGGKLPPPR